MNHRAPVRAVADATPSWTVVRPSAARRCPAGACALGVALLLVGFGPAAPSADGALIEHTFLGRITEVIDPDGLLAVPVAVNDPFTLTLDVDTDAPAGAFPPAFPPTAIAGSYYPTAVTGYGLTLPGGPVGPGDVPVGPDGGAQVVDEASGDAFLAFVGGLDSATIGVALAAVDPGLWNSEALPEDLGGLTFIIRTFSYRVIGTGTAEEPQAEANGTVFEVRSRVIPAPGGAAAPLVLGGAAGLRRRRGRRG